MAKAEVTRFLHCNYNVHDIAKVESWYENTLGLRVLMRTTPTPSTGEAFGIYGDTLAATDFLFDHRGGRRTISLEMVKWMKPETYGHTYPDPWLPGIQSVAYTAEDLAKVKTAAKENGGQVVREGKDWVLLKDVEGLNVEVFQQDGPTEAQYLRIVCTDLDQTLSWWKDLSFSKGPHLVRAPGSDIYPNSNGYSIREEVAMVPKDDKSFGIVFTKWNGPQPASPAYSFPFHAGLFRMAVAVNSVDESYRQLLKNQVPKQAPNLFQLPGTPLTDGLRILFTHDPDSLLVELVERPASAFAK